MIAVKIKEGEVRQFLTHDDTDGRFEICWRPRSVIIDLKIFFLAFDEIKSTYYQRR